MSYAQADSLLLSLEGSTPLMDFEQNIPYIRGRGRGTSLVVQGLRICLPMQGMWVQSLVGELRSHISGGN